MLTGDLSTFVGGGRLHGHAESAKTHLSLLEEVEEEEEEEDEGRVPPTTAQIYRKVGP